MITLQDLFDPIYFKHSELFVGRTYPWEVIAALPGYLAGGVTGKQEGEIQPGAVVTGSVDIGKGTVIEAGAVVFGPAIIGENCLIRSGAYIRGNAIIDDGVKVGHSTEIKNSILLAGSNAAHFNYVGDSILGYKAHLAGGVILSNSKLLAGSVVVKDLDKTYDTGLKKFGASIGDGADIGCNAVLNPGTIIGKNSIVYPLVNWRGVLASDMIAKSSTEIVARKKRPND